MNSRRWRAVAASGLAAWALTSHVPLAAHHSSAEAYDSTKSVEAQGTITKVLFKNPHSFVFVESTDPQGQKVEWQIELGAISSMTRAGWTKEMLAPGMVVKVAGIPSRAPGSHGITNARFTKQDGTPIGPARGAQ